MSSARERFGPPAQSPAEQNLRDLHQGKIKDVSAALQKHGVSLDGRAAPPVQVEARGDNGSNDIRKDPGVPRGERPASSPDDRTRQAHTKADIKQAGETLQKADTKNTTKSQSAAQQFAPSHTPTVAKAPQGRSR